MVLDNKFGKMLYKLGMDYTFKIATASATTDTFYQDAPATYSETTVKAVVIPARAYDIHSNITFNDRITGVETSGILLVFVEQEDCTIDVDDYLNVGSYWYKLTSKEEYGESYYVFEAQLGAEPT